MCSWFLSTLAAPHARPRAGGCAAGRGRPRAGSPRHLVVASLAAAAAAPPCGAACGADAQSIRRLPVHHHQAVHPLVRHSSTSPSSTSSALKGRSVSLPAHLHGQPTARAAEHSCPCKGRTRGGQQGDAGGARAGVAGGVAAALAAAGPAGSKGRCTSMAPAGTAAAPSATPQWHLPSAGKAGALGGGAGGGPEEEKKEEEATATACREHPLHTDPYGSVQHCHTGSPQPSLPDHMAGHRHNLAQQAIVLTTCWLRSCQPSIRDRCETSSSAEILSASSSSSSTSAPHRASPPYAHVLSP